jgi:hypothetical protein
MPKERTMKNVFIVVAVQLLIASFASAAADNYEGCLAYDKTVTLTGTVLLRKIDYKKSDYMPPENSVSFPLLVLDQRICLRPGDNIDVDVAEGMEWTLHMLIPAHASGQCRHGCE